MLVWTKMLVMLRNDSVYSKAFEVDHKGKRRFRDDYNEK